MQVIVHSPYLSTLVFSILLVIAILASMRSKRNDELLSMPVTQELKGFAILTVIFCHIGYFLVTDSRFLFPLSIMSGVGVDLFLFLSGFGLTMSALGKNISVAGFYKKHLAKIYVPLWVTLGIFFILSFFVAHIGYSFGYIARSFAGIFTSADIYHDINSPLWFITPIVFYYLLFPIVFSKKYPWVSAIILFLAGFCIVCINPQILGGVIGLYKLHITAFPVGILFAWLFSRQTVSDKLKKIVGNIKVFAYYPLVLSLMLAIGYLAYFSGVGGSTAWQTFISILSGLLIIVLFILKRVRIGFLSLLGIYSFEIYLIHWPIMYHYDIFYRFAPAWLATALYLGLFLGLGFLLQKLSAKISNVF